jgi:superfamily II DNA or RNA helicase
MLASEREQTERVLARIPKSAFEEYLNSAVGRELHNRLETVRAALRAAGRAPRGARSRPISELIDLLGHRLLYEAEIGEWLREQLIRQLPPSKYRKLVREYREHRGSRAEGYHGNMTQDGAGASTMAAYWFQGSDWAFEFCEVVGLPPALARRQGRALPEDEDVVPTSELPPLHTFQIEAHKKLRKFLRDGRGAAAMLSLPTGAGKTRVTVEAICELLAAANGGKERKAALWLSPSDELQRQAWECFRQVWQAMPWLQDGAARPALPLRIVRLWGGRPLDSVTIGDERTVLIAGIDQVASWVRRSKEKRGERGRLARAVLKMLAGRRLAAAVVDEAHHLANDEHRDVLVALGLREARRWKPCATGAPVVGLTATPWRTQQEELGELLRYFSRRLLRPRSLGPRPVNALQRKRVLARVDCDHVRPRGQTVMNAGQRRRVERFHEIPSDFLAALGTDPDRNAAILSKLCSLRKRSRVLVFACSVNHAEALAMLLNKRLGDGIARYVTAGTPRAERLAIIDEFRRGDGVRFLVNVGVLTTGFDAPRVDVVCIARPTMSALLYEQMVGRGLRGPLNGGTRRCRVIDVQDKDLPVGVQSYGRVLDAWDRPRRIRG